MPNRTTTPELNTDLDFYRAGFPLPSLDRVRPAPAAATSAAAPLRRWLERIFTAARGPETEL